MTTVDLAFDALDLEPLGEPAAEPNRCVCCTTTIKKGAAIKRFSASNGFSDARQLRIFPEFTPSLCGRCGQFFTKPVLMKIQRAILTTDGAFPIAKGENRAWYIYEPPKPPFAVVFSNAKTQHLVWRTPLTLDKDHWKIQLGPRTIVMNRGLVFEALAASRRISEVYLQKKKRQLVSPFRSLAPDLNDLLTGRVRDDVRKFSIEEGLNNELSILESIGPGEMWGLCAVIYRGGIRTQPERLTLN